MPKTYEPCPKAVLTLVEKTIDAHHPDLRDAEVAVYCLFAISDTGQAIMAHGYPALARIKINKLEDRVAGFLDATMLIDKIAWEEMDDEGKAALVDHELEHLKVVIDKEGSLVTDDAGRPKLRIKKHDWQTGGFYSIAKRHQDKAHEVIQIAQVNAAFKQGILQFG